jgi:excisionase family DNA binding protein
MIETQQHQQQTQTGPEPEGYITKEEVARRLKKAVRTIENWQRKGLLPFVKMERSVLFSWPDVVEHLQRNFRVCRKNR